MEKFKRSVLPLLLIGAGFLLLIGAMLRQADMWILMGAFITILAGVLALLMGRQMLSPRLGVVAGVGLGVLALLLGWRNMRAVARADRFTKDLHAHEELVIQGLKDIRTAQMGYLQAHGHYAPDLMVLHRFVEAGHVPVVFRAPNGSAVDDPVTAAVRHDTVWMPAREHLFGLATAHHDRQFPFDVDRFTRVAGSDVEFIMEAGFIEQDGRRVPVFRARDPEPWIEGDTLEVGSLRRATLEGSWRSR